MPETLTIGPLFFNNFRNKPQYAVWQYELSASGTPHYQMYCYWERRIKGLTVSRMFGCNPHLEVRRGKHSEAKEYCCKLDTRIMGPWTFGDDAGIPEIQGARTELISIKRKIDAGSSMKEIAENEYTFSTWCRNERSLKKYKSLVSTPRMWPVECITLVGETGTGKTTWAWNNYPDLYNAVMPKGSGMYYDGYDDHEVVLFDDMYGNRMSHGTLLCLTHEWPFMVGDHGSLINWCPRTIIFTSNTNPSLWYNGRDPITQERKFPWIGGPLQRRLTTGRSRIYRVDHGGELVLLEGIEPFTGPLNFIGPINLIGPRPADI